MAWRRGERLALMTKLLVDRPNHIFSLGEFSALFSVAKSTVSEDLALVRDALAGEGRVETLSGAAGGVRFIPTLTGQNLRNLVATLCAELSDPRRILPGGFLYFSDLIALPNLVQRVGEAFAGRYHAAAPEVVVTLETRGIPLALMTARALDVPLAIVRRVTRASEGSVVTMNYESGSARRLETMSLSRRALRAGERVLIIDDFMKAGGTARGLIDLVGEFEAEVVGVGVLIETAQPAQKLVPDYVSMIVLDRVDDEGREVVVRPSAWLAELPDGEIRPDPNR